MSASLSSLPSLSVVAKFEIYYKQILNKDSVLVAALPEFALNPEVLIDLYTIMQLTRHFDEKAIALQRMGKLGTYAPCHGQEAIGTAIGHALYPDDVFIPYYRDYAALYQRGVDWSEFLAYWGGDERGNQFKNQPHDFPFTVPIASQCLHAAGVAFAFKYRHESRAALVCIGDGGTSEGDFYEAINVAGAFNLPWVCVINNNKWAISVPIDQQTKSQTLAQKAIAAGFEGIQVDGNDVLALREVIRSALDKARRGEGPTLIEAMSYRLCDHTTADDASRYQDAIDLINAQQIEPIGRLKRFLERQINWSVQQEQDLHKYCSEIIKTAINIYLTTPPQPIKNLFDYHFATLPDVLIEQRATAIEEATHV